MNWSDYQSPNSVNRRAGGRRKINAARKARAWERREKIKELIGGQFLLLGSGYTWGLEATLAAYFGVHRSTISRDKDALLAEWRKDHVCRLCGALSTISMKGNTWLIKRGLYDGCTTKQCRLERDLAKALQSRTATSSPEAAQKREREASEDPRGSATKEAGRKRTATKMASPLSPLKKRVRKC